MFKRLKKTFYTAGAAMTLGMMGSAPAFAGGTSNDFNSIAGNMIGSIENLPNLISGVSYLLGALFGVLGILKIKDHVENPQQAPLKEGAIRLAAGGGLFALPIITEAMFETIGSGTAVGTSELNKVKFHGTP